MQKYIFLLTLVIFIPNSFAKNTDEHNFFIKELAQCYVAHEKSRNIDEANTIKNFLKALPSQGEINQMINYAFNYQNISGIERDAVFDRYCSNATDKIKILTNSLLKFSQE